MRVWYTCTYSKCLSAADRSIIHNTLLCIRASKALARLHRRAVSSEPWLLVDAMITKFSCAGQYISLLIAQLTFEQDQTVQREGRF